MNNLSRKTKEINVNEYEVVVTSDSSGQHNNSIVWDIETGSVSKTFKFGASQSKTLCFLGPPGREKYMLSAFINKPMLLFWKLKQENKPTKLSCPGEVSALTVTSNGLYCVAAIEQKMLVWNLVNGNLECEKIVHCQPITCLKFNILNSLLFSSGQDGNVFVWEFYSLFINGSDPLLRLQHKNAPINDLFVGLKIFAAATSKQCLIYTLPGGQLLTTINEPSTFLSVAMDIMDTLLFIGTDNKHIIKVDLDEFLRHEEDIDIKKIQKGVTIGQGHDTPVTCLAANHSAKYLISGSTDGKVIVWKTEGMEKHKTILHKGPITNIVILSPFPTDFYDTGNYSAPEFLPTPLPKLKSSVDKSDIQSIMSLEMDTDDTLSPPSKSSMLKCLYEDNKEDLVNAVDIKSQTNAQIMKLATDYILNRK